MNLGGKLSHKTIPGSWTFFFFWLIFGCGHDRCMYTCISDTSIIMVVFITLKNDLVREIEHVKERHLVSFPAVVFLQSDFTNLGLC